MNSTKYNLIKAKLLLLCYYSCAVFYMVSIIIKYVDVDFYNNRAYFVLYYMERFSTYLWITLMATFTKLCNITKIATIGVLLSFLSDLVIVVYKLKDDYVYFLTTPILVISFSTIILTQLYKWITTQ